MEWERTARSTRPGRHKGRSRLLQPPYHPRHRADPLGRKVAIVAGTRGLAFAAVLMLSPFVSQEAMLRPIDNVKAHDHAREATVADRDVARVHRMLTRHDCWTTAETAAHPGAPGRALVALPDARPTLVDAATGFAIWNGTEDGVLYAFCR